MAKETKSLSMSILVEAMPQILIQLEILTISIRKGNEAYGLIDPMGAFFWTTFSLRLVFSINLIDSDDSYA